MSHCSCRIGPQGDAACYEKKQLVHRQPAGFVRRVLRDFNAGALDAITAASHLGVSRSRLYQLRTVFLQGRDGFGLMASGGDRRRQWPTEARTFLEEFLPLQNPPNYQLVADELGRLCGLVRARSTVEAYVKAHYAHLVPSPARKPRVYRRYRRAHIGELWQHDSSIHQWWPAPSKQILLLTSDDHSGLNLAARFVTSDTTWNHFEHFREAFVKWGLPEIVLQMEVARQNRTVNRTFGERPHEVWQRQSLAGKGRMRPAPPDTLLDLHLSLRCRRRVDNAHSIDFDGQS